MLFPLLTRGTVRPKLPPMKTPLLTAVLALLCLQGMTAKEFKLPEDHPVASVTYPDSWKPEAIEKGVQGQTADNGAYLSVETTTDKKEMATIIDDTFAKLKEHNVDLHRNVKSERKFLINGLPADELLYDGKDEDGPTMVSITFVTVGKTALVLTYWASADSNKKHEREIERILASLKAVQS